MSGKSCVNSAKGHERPLLITLGEPAGIGPDCVIRAFALQGEAFRNAIIVAPPAWLEGRARLLGLSLNIRVHNKPRACYQTGALNVWNPVAEPEENVLAGRPSVETAKTVVACIREAAMSCLRGEARAMVTGPIEKAVLREAGFSFPGHTEFLASLAGDPPFAMMLASKQLRVALLTTHLALREVPQALNIEHAVRTICVVARDLKRRFSLTSPKLALCALNPHGGEQGHFGPEERTILTPAVDQARKQGINIEGPLPADTLFSPFMRKRFDAIVCCYHDQGLIPLKALSFGEAVNITLGLPFVRTSVDHGTALDRVGSPDVNPNSLLAALAMARCMTMGENRWEN
ncbi:MAG: 4-hydroxythreonine-4-phosphate dehydrogenase PdxA [Zetaproteobacteria bacterium]|nr:MAG: 4-hydroxythreonine-4-phosphate dehydrogenase PdxA [Zetaproteobacteria bacterium]